MPATNPTILAIETATAMCSVALLHNGESTQLSEVGNNIHSKVLLGMVQALLETSQISVSELDAVAVGQGPGSFTGLRIGVGVGQGIAYGVGCPMIGVSSLQALATAVTDLEDGHVLAGIDARMGEIYWAEFVVKDGKVFDRGTMKVGPPSEMYCEANAFTLVGNAWGEYWADLNDIIRQRGEQKHSIKYPEAQNYLALSAERLKARDTVVPQDFAPVYVRDDVAKKSIKPLPGRRV